jgi:hypothetical protein
MVSTVTSPVCWAVVGLTSTAAGVLNCVLLLTSLHAEGSALWKQHDVTNSMAYLLHQHSHCVDALFVVGCGAGICSRSAGLHCITL